MVVVKLILSWGWIIGLLAKEVPMGFWGPSALFPPLNRGGFFGDYVSFGEWFSERGEKRLVLILSIKCKGERLCKNEMASRCVL